MSAILVSAILVSAILACEARELHRLVVACEARIKVRILASFPIPRRRFYTFVRLLTVARVRKDIPLFSSLGQSSKFFLRQKTYNKWRKRSDYLVSTLTLTQSEPPLKNSSYATVVK